MKWKLLYWGNNKVTYISVVLLVIGHGQFSDGSFRGIVILVLTLAPLATNNINK